MTVRNLEKLRVYGMNDRASGNDMRDIVVSRIRQKLGHRAAAQLRPLEAVMILEWAAECDDAAQKCDLLSLFDQMGGAKMLREAFGNMH